MMQIDEAAELLEVESSHLTEILKQEGFLTSDGAPQDEVVMANFLTQDGKLTWLGFSYLLRLV